LIAGTIFRRISYCFRESIRKIYINLTAVYHLMKKVNIQLSAYGIIILALLIVSGLLMYKNSQQNYQLSSLEQKSDRKSALISSLNSELSNLEQENNRLSSQISNLSSELSSLSGSNNIVRDQDIDTCNTENSCRFRTPGSGYRCNAHGIYSESGDHYCECSDSCEVTIDSLDSEVDTCTVDNSCKFRSSGSRFICDVDGMYDENGDHYCECSDSCEVIIE